MEEVDEAWSPSRFRVLLAFAIVPGFAAIALASIQPLYAGLDSYLERTWRTAIVFAIFAYPLGLVIGVPTYLWLRDRVKPTPLSCSLAGAFVAGLPWAILSLLPPSADQASIGGKPTVVNGATTAYGHLLALQFIGIIALCGAVAGFLFWLIAVGRKTVR